MKNLIFAITLILSINVCAQNEFENTNIFVRVYDLDGKKIGKGKILSILETSLQLYRKGESVKVMVNGIGSIKTKHSAGINVLVGAAIGATTMAILGAATAEPDAWVFLDIQEEKELPEQQLEELLFFLKILNLMK